MHLTFSTALIIQDPVCSTKDLACVSKINIDASNCLSPCSGLIVTSFSKSEPTKNLEALLFEEITAYNNYTKTYPLPTDLKG